MGRDQRTARWHADLGKGVYRTIKGMLETIRKALVKNVLI